MKVRGQPEREIEMEKEIGTEIGGGGGGGGGDKY